MADETAARLVRAKGTQVRTKGTQVQAEVTIQAEERRLSAHASLAIWDGCNECQVVMSTPTAIYATFVMTVVAQEDASRAIWPSCPALGWTSGVRMLDALPNGHNLTTPKTKATIETHGPYLHGSGFPAVNGDPKLLVFKPSVPIRVSSAPTGIGLPNVFASEFGAAVMSSFESMAPTLAPEHWGLHGGAPAGTRTSSKVMNAVLDDHQPCVFMRRTDTPGVSAVMSSKLTPPMPAPAVRTAVVKKLALMPLVIHFFSPFTL